MIMFGWLMGNKPKILDAQAQALLLPATIMVEGFHTVTWHTGTSLLKTLEAAGIPVRHSCRKGNCGACTAEVLEGKIGYLHPVSFDCPKNEILLCAAVPIGHIRIRLGEKTLKHQRS